ncbi:MAG: flavin reductase family protein [Dehalococcoidia bacterium]
MDEQTAAAKKTILRTIPYGLYILGVHNAGEDSAAAINWVTQTSFEPPLIVMGVKKDSGAYALLKKSGKFALSFLESSQKDLAFAFFKPTAVDGNHINGYEFERGAVSDAPIISVAPGFVEGTLVGEVDMGDHSCVVGQVVDAVLKRDYQILTLKDCGVNYGG